MIRLYLKDQSSWKKKQNENLEYFNNPDIAMQHAAVVRYPKNSYKNNEEKSNAVQNLTKRYQTIYSEMGEIKVQAERDNKKIDNID